MDGGGKGGVDRSQYGHGLLLLGRSAWDLW